MEVDLGLNELSASEKVIMACLAQSAENCEKDSFIASKDVQKQSLCRHIPAPTFFRALSSLLARGLIELPENRSKGLYRITKG